MDQRADWLAAWVGNPWIMYVVLTGVFAVLLAVAEGQGDEYEPWRATRRAMCWYAALWFLSGYAAREVMLHFSVI